MTELNILDYGVVQVISHTGGDLMTVNSARASYGKQVEQLDERDIRLIKYLGDHEHTSPFRHTVVTLYVRAPEFVTRQWYKHIIGANYTEKDHAWNELSQRYVDVGAAGFHTPTEFRAQATVNKQASEGAIMDDIVQFEARDEVTDAYRRIREAYFNLIELGVAREQARIVMPLAIYTEFYWTASLQALTNFVRLRTHPGAQQEIQEYAKAVEQLVRPLAPHSWDALLPESAK